MTTKTQAAKAFANRYGSYSPTTGDYLLDTYRLPSTSAALDTSKAWRDRAEQAEADLKAVMRFLGADKRYEDNVEITDDYSWSTYSWEPPIKRKRVTKTALQKFREDIRTVDKATDAAAALDRLTGGSL